MTLFNRTSSKLRKVGNSNVITVPYHLVQEWNLKANDQLVLYQLDGLLVMVPLAYLGVAGEHPLIRKLIDLTWELHP